MILRLAVSFLLLPFVSGDESRPVISLLGEELRPVSLSEDVLKERLERFDRAMTAYEESPLDPDAITWLGRRTAYLGRYHEAIDIFTRGITLHPEDPRMYRHRGHRYITTRQLDRAVDDLEQAAELIRGKGDEIEPDGLPNARNIPTSTLQSNIWYHLGLARYLKGDFAGAGRAYGECLKVSANNDMRAATTHWFYMTLRRLGRDGEAAELLIPVHEGMEIIENHAYYRLLMFYKGVLAEGDLTQDGADTIERATVGYGFANWLYCEGNESAAYETFDRILESEEWAAFGYIAAEAEKARIE